MKSKFTKELREVEWATVFLLIACYGLWFAGGYLWGTDFWLLGLLALPVVSAFHTSLQHEAIHEHPTRFALLNEIAVSLPLAVVFPYRRYRDLHLKHHNDMNLTDPYEDPESYFWPLESYRTMRPFMRKLFEINNTFVGRLIVGPILTLIGFSRTEWARIKGNEPGVRLAWGLHLPGLAALGLIVLQFFAMPLWVYFIFVVYPALSLTAMRSYAEHQAAENVGCRSAIVETVPPLALLYLNNNLHIVHHANPSIAWYDLPELYHERRQQFLTANGHTLFNGYSDIAKRFAFTVKQPVDHPFMYRQSNRDGEPIVE